MTIDSERDVSFTTDLGKFIYRVAGVIFHENRILLLTEDRFDFWYLPGGRARLFETSEAALEREIKEELAEKPIINRLLWTTECLYHFKAWDINHHELAFYYLCHFSDSSPIHSMDEGVGTELFSNEPTTLRFKWFSIGDLQTVNLVPKFLKNGLKNIPTHSTHLILNELK